MTDYEVLVASEPTAGVPEGTLEWIDHGRGIASVATGERAETVIVEGGGTEWTVTVRGRRIPVTVRSWRERVLAEAEGSARVQGGATSVKATLPGLVVAVRVAAGDEVIEGAALLTIEAMKMQNEVRAPRAGRVLEVAVRDGQAVATGAPLVTLE